MNIHDVAAEAGVSVATVSRVLNPASQDPVRPETRERVMKAAQRLGYRPNELARALLRRRSGMVGLVIPDIANPYYPELARGVEDVASANGHSVVLCNTDRNAAKTDGYLDALVKSRVDGIIIAGGSADSAPDPEVFAPYRTKVVVVGRHNLPFPSVQVDNVAAARLATDHLIGLGHRAMAFLTGPTGSHTAQDRVAGYRLALAEHGLPYREELVVEGDFREASGYAAVPGLLAARPRPTAIVASNDLMALGTLAALNDAGLTVPGDISLVGLDDVALASYARPALTSVAIPAYDMGAQAMSLLLADAEGGNGPVVLPTRMVVRASTAAPPS